MLIQRGGGRAFRIIKPQHILKHDQFQIFRRNHCGAGHQAGDLKLGAAQNRPDQIQHMRMIERQHLILERDGTTIDIMR